MPFALPTLNYDYNALEPHFDAQTMEIHHTKHHQAYVTNLNNAIAGTEAENLALEDILKNISQYAPAVRNNAGGHYNHTLFWNTLAANPQTAPTGELADAINAYWGSVEAFKEAFNKEALTRFGSGWAWLLVKYNGQIELSSTANQDNPLMDINPTSQGLPILGLDVWEHAYYLKYQNRRADYINAFWNVLDWAKVEAAYAEAKKGF